MSAVSDADLLNTVYTVAPEFTTMNDSDVLQVMDLAKLFVSEKKFGKFYSVALADYTAHLLTLRAETASSAKVKATFPAPTGRPIRADLAMTCSIRPYTGKLTCNY